jgi:S1-C subfamily serine protease
MSFLDDVPLDWTRDELGALRDLLVMAYRRQTAAEQLAEEVGLAPGTFPIQFNMRTTWTELLTELGNQNLLRAAVERAAADPSAAAYRPRLEDMLDDEPALAPPQPLDGGGGWWNGGDPAALFPERLMERRSRLMPVELASAVSRAARSVAKLSLRFGAMRAHGTGFLIQPSWILTNHHNVVHEQYGQVTAIIAEFDYEAAFHGVALVRKGILETIVGSPEDDWAAVELESAVDRAPLSLGTPFDVGIDDTLVIIQHPQGAYKQFSLEPLAIRQLPANRLQYVADTQQGSSGSPVFNTRMHVVGLHHAETEATVMVDGRPDVVWLNQGIDINTVMRQLGANGVHFDPQE